MFNLNEHLNSGIRDILKTAGRFYLKDTKGIACLAKVGPAMAKAAKRREANEAAGLHVPVFLSASIAAECNLRCTGCYAWANGTVGAVAYRLRNRSVSPAGRGFSGPRARASQMIWASFSAASTRAKASSRSRPTHTSPWLASSIAFRPSSTR